MIEALQEIRNLALALQAESSTHDPRQRKIARIIEIVDDEAIDD